MTFRIKDLFKFTQYLNLTVRIGETNDDIFRTVRERGKYYHVIFLGRFRPYSFFDDPEGMAIDSAHDLAHELGHYLIAPKGRRHRSNYGIVPYGKRSLESMLFWDLDESKATLVEHYLRGYFGDPKARKKPLRAETQWRMRAVRGTALKWWREEGQKMVDEQLKGFRGRYAKSA